MDGPNARHHKINVMSKKTYTVPFLFLLASIPFIVAGQTGENNKRLSLQQCIEIATTKNIDVRQSEVVVEQAAVAYQQTKNNLLPNLNGLINHGINQGRSIDPFTNGYVNQQINYAEYAVGSSVILFNGSRLKNTIQQNALAYDATQLELQQTKDNITINVILAYLQVLNNEELLALAKSQASVTQQQIQRLEVLNKQGAISPPLLHDLKGQILSDELAVLNSRNILATAKLALTQLMNIPYDSTLTLEAVDAAATITIEEGLPNVYDRALKNLAIIKAGELRRKSAEAAVKAVRGELYPTVTLNGNLNTNFSSVARKDILLNSTFLPTADYVIVNGSQLPVVSKQNNIVSERIAYNSQLKNNIFSNINLGIRVPIFNGAQTRNRIRQAQLEVKRVALAEEKNKQLLLQQVEDATLNLKNAFERYQVARQQIDEYTQSFKAAEVRFNAGVGTSVDYILAKNNVDRANNNLVLAKYDFLLRQRVLDFYSGEK
jgi:outer membrane protein